MPTKFTTEQKKKYIEAILGTDTKQSALLREINRRLAEKDQARPDDLYERFASEDTQTGWCISYGLPYDIKGKTVCPHCGRKVERCSTNGIGEEVIRLLQLKRNSTLVGKSYSSTLRDFQMLPPENQVKEMWDKLYAEHERREAWQKEWNAARTDTTEVSMPITPTLH